MKKTETETSSSSSLAWIKLSYNEGNTKLASTVLIEKKDIKIILKSNYDSSKCSNPCQQHDRCSQFLFESYFTRKQIMTHLMTH